MRTLTDGMPPWASIIRWTVSIVSAGSKSSVIVRPHTGLTKICIPSVILVRRRLWRLWSGVDGVTVN